MGGPRTHVASSGPGDTAVGGASVQGRTLADDVLQGGEIVIISIRANIGAVVLRSLPFVLPMALAGLAGVYWLAIPKATIASSLGVMILTVFAWFALDWSLTRYVLTDRRVMVVRGGSGFGGRVVRETLVPAVHGLSLEHTIRESLLGLGSIEFVPDHGGRVRWEMLGRAEDVYSIARDAIGRYGRGRLHD